MQKLPLKTKQVKKWTYAAHRAEVRSSNGHQVVPVYGLNGPFGCIKVSLKLFVFDV